MSPESALDAHLSAVDAGDAGPCDACGAASSAAQVEWCIYEGRNLCADCRAVWDEEE